MFKKVYLFLSLMVFLSGCASTTLQAPCNQNATFCGTKTKINNW